MNELKQKLHEKLLAKKQAGLGEDASEGINAPLSRMSDGRYNMAGAALMGGGTGLATYLISRLFGLKNGPSIVAALLGGLGGVHYSMGKQYANGGVYSPLNFNWFNDAYKRWQQAQKGILPAPEQAAQMEHNREVAKNQRRRPAPSPIQGPGTHYAETSMNNEAIDSRAAQQEEYNKLNGIQ